MIDKHQSRNEEIDLFHFLKPVTDSGKRLGRGLSAHFKDLYRLRIPALIILLAITAFGYALRFWVTKSYKTEGLFVSHVLPSSYCSMMIENLDELNKAGGNNNIVAQHLQIGEAPVADITSIALVPIADTQFVNVADTVFSLFRIDLVLKDMKNLDTIQRGILNYLENSDYAKKRKAARKESLLALKQEIRNRITSLDTLKRLVNSSVVPRSEGRGVILGEPLNPVLVYDAEKEYYNTELKVNEDLAVIDNVEIIQPFLRRNNFNYPDFRLLLLQFFIAGLIASIILTPILFSRKHR